MLSYAAYYVDLCGITPCDAADDYVDVDVGSDQSSNTMSLQQDGDGDELEIVFTHGLIGCCFKEVFTYSLVFFFCFKK